MQAKPQFQGRRWIYSAPVSKDEQGRSEDQAAGAAILLSNRMADKVLGQWHVGTRIVWVRVVGPMCNIFFIVVYVPHKGRTTFPLAQDTLGQLRKFLETVKKSDYIILCGDFNCQLQRNVQGCIGKWCMTERPQQGHGEEILDIMRIYDLFAVDILFRPRRKKWQGKYRICNATYIPKDEKQRPTKLDYI